MKWCHFLTQWCSFGNFPSDLLHLEWLALLCRNCLWWWWGNCFRETLEGFAPPAPQLSHCGIQNPPFQMVRWSLGDQTQQELIQFSSVAQSCLTICNPMSRSMPGLPVHHQLPEFTQIHVHWVCDAIQPSHPLSSPSPHAFNLSQHQGLFKWVSSLHEVAKVLEFQLQH